MQAIRKGLHIGLSYLAISASSFQGCRPLTEIGAIGPILTNMCLGLICLLCPGNT
jgi:hypothetical protein